jgi:hypothetical protein
MTINVTVELNILRQLFVNQTAGAPVFNSKWIPEPKARGTYTILSTCVITMLLCVWTAVHLNLPEPRGFGHQLGRKIGWLIMGLLAPEMVLRLKTFVSRSLLTACIGGIHCLVTKPSSQKAAYRDERHSSPKLRTQKERERPVSASIGISQDT